MRVKEAAGEVRRDPDVPIRAARQATTGAPPDPLRHDPRPEHCHRRAAHAHDSRGGMGSRRSRLKADSAVNLHHVVTIPQAGLRRFVGTVPPEILARVRAALLFAFGFE